MPERRLSLFSGFGVEIEYMIVDARTLDVAPRADRLLAAVAGEPASEVERGAIAWSNELVRHVVELKTNGPAPSLDGLAALFQAQVEDANQILAGWDQQLMPGGMHPWMDPARETRLWLDEHAEVYSAFDRIFGCSGHGWSNLQSTHLNLPFATDAELGRLHAAIRLILPLLPALAASSPFVEGRLSGRLDSRLHAYRDNARRVPSVSGRVIPEPVFTAAAYQDEILSPMYGDIAPHDPEGILQHEWLNARGAIARFDRGTIEIRLLDVQECPLADLALIELVVQVLRDLVEEQSSPLRDQQSWPVAPLAHILDATVRDADEAIVDHPAYLRTLGIPAQVATAAEIWRDLAARAPASPQSPLQAARETILARGPLARRMMRRVGPQPTRGAIEALSRDLCRCLARGELLLA